MSKQEFGKEDEYWAPIVACPVCNSGGGSIIIDPKAKKYDPQQLFDHLMSRAHSKEEIVEFVQEQLSFGGLSQ